MINRKKREKLKVDIIKILINSNRPCATQEIAEELGKPWHSIQTRCLMLQIEGDLVGFRVGRINLWQINPKKQEVDEESGNKSENNVKRREK